MAQSFDYKVVAKAKLKGSDKVEPLTIRERAYNPIDAMMQACIKASHTHTDMTVVSVEPDSSVSEEQIDRIASEVTSALLGTLGKGKR